MQASDITVSTIKGEINILQDHTHLISKLFTGLLVVKNKNKKEYFTVEKGICKILGNTLTILSSSSLKKNEIDVDEAKNSISKINNKLKKTDLMSDEEISHLYDQLDLYKSHIALSKI